MIEFNYGWILDKLGAKFAPKTTSNLVIDPDNGKTVYAELNEFQAQIDENASTIESFDEKFSGVETKIENITSGTTVVPEAMHATSANEALKATQDGNGNVIADTYETKTSSNTKFDEAKAYTDEKVNGMATTSVVDSKISAHNTDVDAHGDIRVLISDLSTEVSNFLDVDDTTRDQLSEVLTLIDNNKGTLDSLTTSKVNVADIVDNLTTASANKVLSANQGVALKSLIDSLEALVETKADASALTNYYTKEQIDGYEFITVSDIDNICGSGIQLAREVMF